ncbi:MAG: hypothetical protein SVV67_08395 [Bacillota bacterium]|nr:hypothetical protein [Bacillota bacterium]
MFLHYTPSCKNILTEQLQRHDDNQGNEENQQIIFKIGRIDKHEKPAPWCVIHLEKEKEDCYNSFFRIFEEKPQQMEPPVVNLKQKSSQELKKPAEKGMIPGT